MNEETWAQVDNYFSDMLLRQDHIPTEALRANAAAGLPAIDVSANQGKMLELLVKMRGAEKVLEIGTLGGYSTIWMARGLPEHGKLVTLEIDPRHAAVATENLQRAGFASQVEVIVGKALETLPKVAAENKGPFDFVFIDADKANIPEYFQWALKLSRPGAVIIVDNVVRDGKVVDAESMNEAVKGVRRLNDLLAQDARVEATAVQTVSTKGWDGFIMAVVKG